MAACCVKSRRNLRVGLAFVERQALRAALVAVENFNQSQGKREIDSLVCCGLGTGIGKVSANKCAMQMRAAYQVMKAPSRIPSYHGIHAFHKALLSM